MASERPSKRARLDKEPLHSFSSADQIIACLENANTEDACIHAVTCISVQLRVNSGEVISPKDNRLYLVCQWALLDLGFKRLLDIYNYATHRRSSLYSLLPSLLCSIFSLLNAHYTNHHHGLVLLRTLISPLWMRKFTTSLTAGAQYDVILHTLRLLNVMSAFSGGSERAALLDSSNWDIKCFFKLLNMRRKSQTQGHPLRNPDIRTLTLMYILSFISTDSLPSLKIHFLTNHSATFSSIFKELFNDSYDVVRFVLETCWTSIWADVRISRSLKISVFSENTVAHIVKLYERDSRNEAAEHSPAELAHHFLLALLTRRGTGLCFHDKGWYPKSDSTDGFEVQLEENWAESRNQGLHNKILANILKTLKVGEYVKHQELALQILQACPELVSGYWAASGLSLTPRLSCRWITNISFAGYIIDLSIPHESFYSPAINSGLHSLDDPKSEPHYNPCPPPLSAVLANLIPSTLTKTHLTKGLSSSSPYKSSNSTVLVRHCTVIMLIKILSKMQAILASFERISVKLEEEVLGFSYHGTGSTRTGQWSNRCREIAQEVRNRVPEFGVILAISREFTLEEGGSGNGFELQSAPVEHTLLHEMIQRLICLYHVCLPDTTSDTKFDPGKMLIGTEVTTPYAATPAGLKIMKALHILKTLGSCHESWILTDKPRGSSSSYLHILLSISCRSSTLSLRHSAHRLLMDLLQKSVVFTLSSNKSNLDEISVWLEALQCEDDEETTGFIISFYEECVQRCHKTPYRYLEDIQRLCKATSGVSCTDLDPTSALAFLPSPLLMTVVEQCPHKLTGSLSEYGQLHATKGMCGMLKRLVFGLIGCMYDYGIPFMIALIEKLRGAIDAEDNSTSVLLHKELLFMEESIRFLVGDRPPVQTSSNLRLESATMAASASFPDRYISYLLSCQSHSSTRMPSVLMQHDTLLEAIFEHRSSRNLSSVIRRSIRIALHSLLVPSGARDASSLESVLADRLRIAAAIIRQAQQTQGKDDFIALKSLVFGERNYKLRKLLTSEHISPSICSVIERELLTFLDSDTLFDRNMVSEVTESWATWLLVSFQSETAQTFIFPPAGLLWVSFMKNDVLLETLDHASRLILSPGEVSNMNVLSTVIATVGKTLRQRADIGISQELIPKIPSLFTLRTALKAGNFDGPPTLHLDSLITQAVSASSPLPLDPHNVSTGEALNLRKLVKDAKARWKHPLESRNTYSREDILNLLCECEVRDENWTQAIISVLVAGDILREAHVQWIHPAMPLATARISAAYCESLQINGYHPSTEYESLYIALLPSLLDYISEATTTPLSRVKCVDSIIALARIASPAFFATTCKTLTTQFSSHRGALLTASLLNLCHRLYVLAPSDEDSLRMLEVSFTSGLKWAAQYLSEGAYDDEGLNALEALANLVDYIEPPAFLAEPVLTSAVLHCLLIPPVVRFCSALVQAAKLKPVVVNKHLQSIIQHPKFHEACQAPLCDQKSRASVVELLYNLFFSHPWNASQASHLLPLLSVYHGSLAAPDRQLLSIFRLFEDQRKISIASLLSQWSASQTPVDGCETSALRSLCSLDQIRIFRTSLALPHRGLTDDFTSSQAESGSSTYIDPLLCALLFCQMLANCPPRSISEWLELFRTNIVGLLIRYLSAKDHKMRLLVYHCLAGLHAMLEPIELQEKTEIQLLLNLLRDQIIHRKIEFPRRLPSYTTLLLCYALRGIFFPANFTYRLTAKFLLQRPEMDTTDVPLLYEMLYSSSDEWKKERIWLIRFLTDGMLGLREWRVLKRRHTWDLLASLFEGSPGDHHIRKGILECLANLTCNGRVSVELVAKQGLLSWIEMQVSACLLLGEALQWLRILENVIVAGYSERIESITHGQWRVNILRCLEILFLREPRLVFPVLPSVVLRLLLLPGSPTLRAQNLLEMMEVYLDSYEEGVTMRTSGGEETILFGPPYRAQDLHESPPLIDSVEVWGRCVQAMWICAMEIGNIVLIDALTCRLLVWRSICGNKDNSEGEWVREEVLRNISIGSPLLLE